MIRVLAAININQLTSPYCTSSDIFPGFVVWFRSLASRFPRCWGFYRFGIVLVKKTYVAVGEGVKSLSWLQQLVTEEIEIAPRATVYTDSTICFRWVKENGKRKLKQVEIGL